MLKPSNLLSFIKGQPKWRVVAVLLLVIGAGIWLSTRGGKTASAGPTFAARRGPLEITVLEGGSLQALESQEVKCEVRVGHQGTKILKIVEEGYLVSDEDVKTGKVLVELDSSDLQQQITQQEIQYQSAFASLIDAEQAYEIQLRQNQSDVQAAEQKVRFARMDFDKFLGDAVASKVIEESGLEALLAAASTNVIEEPRSPDDENIPPQRTPVPVVPLTNSPVASIEEQRHVTADSPVKVVPAVLRTASDSQSGTSRRAMREGAARVSPDQVSATVEQIVPNEATRPVESLDETAIPSFAVRVDFRQYADINVLGDGEAKQKLRKLDDDLQVAKKELGQATTTLEGTRRLFEKGFVTRNDLQRDEISFENSRLKVQTAETARDLFMKYDFLKQAEESLSKFADSVRELDKARRVAVSKQAQSRARLSSSRGQHTVQLQRRNELREQITKCVIVAQKPGLVVYGGGREEYFGGEERIREGATVRERQSIITIPDMSRMAVNVKVHESYIKKIRKGQKTRITVDAYPDKVLMGEVTKVAVLPDSQNRWMNPDMKIYNTTVTIDGSHEWAKPGMSAKVEILVSEIPDCIYIPLQAVHMVGEKQVCYVAGFKAEQRELKLGEFNDNFIEVRSGLSSGENVYLRPPPGFDSKGKSGEADKAPTEKQQETETSGTAQAKT